MVLQNDIDLLNPPAELEKKKHKLKRLVQSPNSFFMIYGFKYYLILYLYGVFHFLIPGFILVFLAERPYLATLKLWWCVVTARQFYASLLVVELDSLKDPLSGKRVTKSNGYDRKKSFMVFVLMNVLTCLCQPTGGRARLTEGSSFRKKGD
ncbi:hypothetical protein CRYUN_Cryun23aG0037100 [Craigia yunnanensis]